MNLIYIKTHDHFKLVKEVIGSDTPLAVMTHPQDDMIYPMWVRLQVKPKLIKLEDTIETDYLMYLTKVPKDSPDIKEHVQHLISLRKALQDDLNTEPLLQDFLALRIPMVLCQSDAMYKLKTTAMFYSVGAPAKLDIYIKPEKPADHLDLKAVVEKSGVNFSMNTPIDDYPGFQSNQIPEAIQVGDRVEIVACPDHIIEEDTLMKEYFDNRVGKQYTVMPERADYSVSGSFALETDDGSGLTFFAPQHRLRKR